MRKGEPTGMFLITCSKGQILDTIVQGVPGETKASLKPQYFSAEGTQGRYSPKALLSARCGVGFW